MKKATKRPAPKVATKVRNTSKPSLPDNSKALPARIANEFKQEMIANGLADVLGLNDGLTGFNPGSIGAPLSQVDTLFLNNRWYMISNMRQVLSELYVEHGLIQTLIDVPVDDGMRGGVEISSKQLNEEQLQLLGIQMERESILSSVVGQAAKWNRLYGGAGIIIMTDQDPEEPLDISAINENTPLEFRAVDMWELFWDKQNAEGFDMELQEQKYEFYNYYAVKLHKSRVMKLKGLVAPSFVRPRLRGWGFSIVESVIRSLNQYLKANNLVFEVLDEFKVDVYKIKNFVNTLLSPNGAAQIQKRMQVANQQKNYQHAIVMDGEDDFQQKELSFSGLAETMVQIRMQIASDLRMPLTKVFGISAAGFNSGEDDIEVYNSMVESSVRGKVKFDIIKIIEIMCQKNFGMIPTDLSIDFKPLRMLSAEQEETVKTQKFNRALQAKQAGEITTEEFRDILNRDNLLGIQLEKDDDILAQLEEENQVEDTENEGVGKDEKATTKASAGKSGSSSLSAKEPPKAKNSLEYDKKSYDADGGGASIDLWKKRIVDDPNSKLIDIAKLNTAKQTALKLFGPSAPWQFVIWKYEKLGGKAR